MMTFEDQQLALALTHDYNLRYTQQPRRGDLAIDRIPGPSMTSAIRSFQEREGLQADGLWGPQTEAAVRKAIAEGRTKPAPDVPDIEDGEIEKAIWDFLRSKGFPAAAAAGIMGNLDAESRLKPNNLEDYYQAKLGYTDQSYTAAVDSGAYARFATDQAGYGLAQWTWHTRKRGLLEAAKKAGKSISNAGVQLNWLWQELSTQYATMTQRLQQPGITVYDATRLFMVQFENPADKSDTAVSRRAGISQIYFDRYAK